MSTVIDLSKRVTRKLLYVDAKVIHPSSLLPKREFDAELVASIKRDHIQQPIIVRPSPRENDKYEIIDGHGRHESMQSNGRVLVDVRYGLNDEGVFRISEATFKRKPRTTYERAFFYSNWVKTQPESQGAQKRVAKMANLSEAEISHYLSISRLFIRLGSYNIALSIFNALKNQSVNKLYAVAKVKDKAGLLEIVAKIAEKPDITVKELKSLIEHRNSMQAIKELLDDEEESESARLDQMKGAAQQLKGVLDKTAESLSVLNQEIRDHPHIFIPEYVLKKIKRIQNAFERIEKEIERIMNIGKQKDL